MTLNRHVQHVLLYAAAVRDILGQIGDVFVRSIAYEYSTDCNIVRLTMGTKNIKIDAAEPEYNFLYSTHSSSLSKPGAYIILPITHSVARPLTVQLEIWVR